MQPLHIMCLWKDRGSLGLGQQWKDKVQGQQHSSREDKHKELKSTFSTTFISSKKQKESIPWEETSHIFHPLLLWAN